MVFRGKAKNGDNQLKFQNIARPILSFTITACLTLSCKQASELPLQTPAEANEDESADMPENVSGVYLVACAVDKYPSKSAYGRYPCRIQNKKQGDLAPKPPASWNVITPER